MIKTGQAWAGLFVTLDATGAASAADSTPTGTLYVDGVSDAATVTITGSNPYKFAVTLPTLTAGQRVDMYIAATIDTIATAGIVASAQADTVLVSDIVGADSDTLETLSDEIAAVKAETALIVADTGTDGVKIADTQGAITWGQQKIVADVEFQGALDIKNTNVNGAGKSTFGGIAGEYNYGVAAAGVYNISEEGIGVSNEGYSYGVRNEGIYGGMYNKATGVGSAAMYNDARGTDGIGLKNVGEAQNVEGFDPAQATEATLTAIKGAGWMDETLVKIVTDIAAIQAGSGATPQQIWEYATRVLTAGTNIDLSALATATDLATVDTVVDAIKAKTDNLPASPAAVGSAMTLTAAYDKAKDDVLTPLAVVDSIVDGLKTTLDNIHDTDLPAVKTETAAIKTKTDNLPATPASAGEYNAALTAIQADLDNPAQYKADVSGLATQASVNAIPTTPLLAANYTAPDNATIGEIKAKTDNIPATPLTAQQVWEYVTRELTSQGSGGATAQEVWEYATRVLTAGTNIDLTPLAKTTHLQEVEDKVDGIKGITDQLTFTVPNKVDASATVDPTGIATSEELDIIGEKVDGVLNKLNVSSVEFVTAVVGSNITILRGDTLAARLLDLGDLTQYASLDFTVKRVAGELDDAAKIRLRKNASGTDDGLLRINGAEYATATDGSIVIDDLTTGDIEIKLNAAATRELVPGNYVYDVQLIIANEVRTLTAGKLEVVADVTRAVA